MAAAMYGLKTMNRKWVALSALACLVLLGGCDRKTQLPEKPQVVSKKIQMESERETVEKEGKVAKNSSGSNIGKGKIAGGKMEPRNSTGTIEKALEKESLKSEVEEKAVKPRQPDETEPSDKNEMKSVSKKATSVMQFPKNSLLTKKLEAKGPPLYNPEDKIDPFMPLFREEPKKEVVETTPKKKKRIPRTPLERLDLSQLELVGIIQAPGGNKGLVEEASGKGYIVSKGTYMGRNGGRVTEIRKDRIVVKEEVLDVLGKTTVQKKVLKIQKPFGED